MQYLRNNDNEQILQSFYKKIVISGAALIALYLLFYIYFKAYAAAIICVLLLVIVVPVILYFNTKKSLYASRLLTVIAFSGSTFTLALAHNNLNNNEYYFLPAMMLSLLFFKPDQKNEIAFSLFLPIICWISLNIFPNPLAQTNLLPPESYPYKVVSIANFIGAAGFVYILLRFYLQSAIRTRQVEFENEQKLLLASKLASIGELATGIAHEINNPLSVIVGRTQILKSKIEKMDPSNSDLITCKQNLEKIEETANLITKIVKGLNHFSRESELDEKMPHSIQKIVGFAIELCEERLKAKNISLVTEKYTDALIHCREVQITQILVNLLNNSIDAIENSENRWIEINIQKNSKYVKISVKDSGSGISKQIADKIMNPFFSTKQTGKGIGLGLSISKSIAETHDGKLSLDTLSEHTKFDLELPILPEGVRAE